MSHLSGLLIALGLMVAAIEAWPWSVLLAPMLIALWLGRRKPPPPPTRSR